jgi:hypothetical protein
MHSGRGVGETSSSRTWRRSDGRTDGGVSDDPFALLGLEARTGLSDDDVRAAWRRIAAATHPDREDGGDPARFGAAAAAYVMLRTGFGRGEALADLGLGAATAHGGRHAHRRRPSSDPAAPGGGRHRARRRAPADRRTGLRLPGLTLLKKRISRPAATPDLPVGRKQGPTDATSYGSGDAATQALGEATAQASGQGNANRPSAGVGTANRPPVESGNANRPSVGSGNANRRSVGSGNANRRSVGSGNANRRSVGSGNANRRAWGLRLRPRPIRRPGGLGFRVACATAVSVVAVVISGWSPGVVGVLAGVLTWLLVTAGQALARRRSQ